MLPAIVAYWKVPAAVSDRPKVLMTSGMIKPTESVVIANIANIKYVRVLTTVMLRPESRAMVTPPPSSSRLAQALAPRMAP